MARYRLQIQKPKNLRDLMYATLYDLTLPPGRQILAIGPIDSVADMLLQDQEVHEISLTYESPN